MCISDLRYVLFIPQVYQIIDETAVNHKYSTKVTSMSHQGHKKSHNQAKMIIFYFGLVPNTIPSMWMEMIEYDQIHMYNISTVKVLN